MKPAPDIFIAYSHNDLRYKDELKKFLRPLLNTKRASLWDDHDIEAGKEWEAEIKKRLYGADIILLLVSSDSLASDYFYGREVAVSLERHEKGEAVVVPVIIRPCVWMITPLSKLEALPAKGKAVTQWLSQDEAFTEIAHRIGDIVAKIAETHQKTADEVLQRQAFQAALQAADHLRDKAQWLQAVAGYAEALHLHQRGFVPDVATLQARMAECETRQKQAIEKLQPAPDNFIRISGGTFRMGDLFDEGSSDEKPIRDVTLSDFYLSAFELTVGEFRAFISATNYRTDADKGGGSYIWTGSTWEKKDGVNWEYDIAGKLHPSAEDKHPVIHVSWNDAIAYCNWLSEQRGLQKAYAISGSGISTNWSANGYRLPTEAEWEYAARQGGKRTRFGNGKDTADPKEINLDGRTGGKQSLSITGECRIKTVPVGSLNSPNDLGLHDMSGNVWEWCWDWYAAYPADAQTNPKGPDSGSDRVFRGGSWSVNPANVRCANRDYRNPVYRGSFLGFRLARAVR